MALVSPPRKTGAPAVGPSPVRAAGAAGPAGPFAGFPLALPADRPLGVLFVCMGNICRSPLAEGAFRAAAERAGLGDRVVVASAGLTDFHEGEPPDRRAIAVARAHGIDISGQRSRPLMTTDFLDFDVLLAMDHQNMTGLDARRPDHAPARTALLMEAAEGRRVPIPDPYYGDAADFEAVLDTVTRAADRLVARLKGEG